MTISLPNNQDFANEVRTERLTILWRITLGFCILAAWGLLSVAMLQRTQVTQWLLVIAVLALGCFVTRTVLNRGGFTLAVWLYAGSLVGSVGIALAMGNEEVIRIFPFLFPIAIFVIGLLLPPVNTFIIATVSAAITVLAPMVTLGNLEFVGIYQVTAIILTFLSAFMAAQATGELHAVTEWALSNYQRERRISGELYENRELVERSLRRMEALSDSLKVANEELQRAQTAAEEAKHYRGQFLANMSHELRTPLNAIIGFSETMLKFPAMYDNVALPPAYESDLNQIYSSGRLLLNLINDILDLSKVDAGKLDIKMAQIDLKPIINGVMSTAGGLISDRPIRLTANIPENIPTVYADDARVRQVLLNLYSNAAKFTDEGTIGLEVFEADDGGIQISVSDTGSGIAQHNLEMIFEEFKQAETDRRDPRSGAGLGLAISRQLVTLMGGEIWAESTLGKGSVFHVKLQPYQVNNEATIPSALIQEAG